MVHSRWYHSRYQTVDGSQLMVQTVDGTTMDGTQSTVHTVDGTQLMVHS